MKQYEAVIKVMEENGGYATLAHLNQYVMKVEGCEWKSKTPFASIRRIVQDNRFFFKIRPGLWALNSYKNKLSPEIFPSNKLSKTKIDEYNHTYYQGLLIELGNMRRFETFVPNQDRNKLYLGKKLSSFTTFSEIYNFGYDKIVKTAKTIDVTWFNERKMPSKFFEIEHSTNIKNSLLKFVELQDFNSQFYIVADNARKNEFKDKISMEAFKPVIKRINFLDYENLAELHTKTSELFGLQSPEIINISN